MDKKRGNYIHPVEVIAVYLLVIGLMYIAYIQRETSITIAAFIIAATLSIFVTIFRKRPNSANFSIGIPTRIDLRWHLKAGESMPEDRDE